MRLAVAAKEARLITDYEVSCVAVPDDLPDNLSNEEYAAMETHFSALVDARNDEEAWDLVAEYLFANCIAEGSKVSLHYGENHRIRTR